MISGLHFFIFRRKLTIRSSSQRQYKDWMRWLRYPHVNLRLTCASRNRAEQFKLLWVFQSAKVRCLSANLCGLLETHILGLFGSPLLCTLQLPLPCTLLPPLRTALLPVASSGKKKKKTFKTCKIQLKIHHKKNHSVTFMENWHSGEWRGRGIIPAISTTLKEIVTLLHCFFFLQHFIVSKSYDSLRTAIPPSSSSLLSTIHFQESNLYGRSHRDGFASESERHSKIEPKKGLSSLIIY